MQVELSSEQVQLQDGVRRLLENHYSFEKRQKYAAVRPGWSTEVWQHYGEMGLHAIAIPSGWGGLDGGAAELLPVVQEMGRALVMEPFVASSVLGACALSASSEDALKDRLLGAVATGDHLLAFAHEERGLSLADVGTHAQRRAEGWTITGRKCAVLHARDAQSLVVTARMAGGDDGMGLFLVSRDAPGLHRHDYVLVDQRTASDLILDGVPATEIASPSAATTLAIERTLALGTAVLVAEAAGAMRAALEATTAYLSTRKQFGKALSEFQALRHRAAEMLVSVETVEAMAYLAAIAVDHPESRQAAERDLASAKLLAGHHGRWVCEQAIQLHGAIGMTDEYVVGHYLQRLAVIDALLGNEDVQLDRLAHIARAKEESTHG